MKKDIATILGLSLLVVAVLILGQGFNSISFVNQSSSSAKPAKQKGYTTVSVRNLTISAKVVSKASDREKGLSGVDSMPLSQGMLFVFEKPGGYVFWMKNMKFALDMVWIDQNKKIIDMTFDVPPEPGKSDDQLHRYQARGNSLYVLEINAGLARLNGLQIGDSVNFTL